MTPAAAPSPLYDALRWAAGANVALPTDMPDSPEGLYRHIRRHRLGVRFYERLTLTDKRPAWCDATLLTLLRAERAQAVIRQYQKLQAYQEVAALFPLEQRPIPLKGFTTYVLSRQTKHIRRSGDLDLLSPDPSALVHALQSLGYRGELFGPERHEMAHLRRGAVAVEVHRYLPVYSYPAGMADTAECLTRQQFSAPERQELHYGALSPQLVRDKNGGDTEVPVLNPSTAALVLCAHEFKEYLTSPFELSIPVRMAVVADIRDLLDDPRFVGEHFLRQCHDTGGEDALALVSRLLGTWFGEVPSLLSDFKQQKKDAFPRPLGCRGVWAALTLPEDAWTWPNYEDVLQRFGSAPVLHRVRPDAPPFKLTWSHGVSGSLTTTHLSFTRRRNRSYRLRLDAANKEGRDAPHFLLDINPDGRVVAQGCQAEHVSQGRDCWEVCIRAPAPQGASSLLTVTSRVLDRDDFFDADYVATVAFMHDSLSEGCLFDC